MSLWKPEPISTCEDAAPKQEETWLLVTSDYHMLWAVACFRFVNWQVLPYPADYKYVDAFEVHALTTNLLYLDRAVHEWLGLLHYRLQGRIEDLFSAQ